MNRLAVLLPLAAFLVGCGSSILILDEPPPCQYQKLGIVTGSDLLKDYEDMISELKKGAWNLGADAVLVDKKFFEVQNTPFSERPGTINGTAIKYGPDCK